MNTYLERALGKLSRKHPLRHVSRVLSRPVENLFEAALPPDEWKAAYEKFIDSSRVPNAVTQWCMNAVFTCAGCERSFKVATVNGSFCRARAGQRLHYCSVECFGDSDTHRVVHTRGPTPRHTPNHIRIAQPERSKRVTKPRTPQIRRRTMQLSDRVSQLCRRMAAPTTPGDLVSLFRDSAQPTPSREDIETVFDALNDTAIEAPPSFIIWLDTLERDIRSKPAAAIAAAQPEPDPEPIALGAVPPVPDTSAQTAALTQELFDSAKREKPTSIRARSVANLLAMNILQSEIARRITPPGGSKSGFQVEVSNLASIARELLPLNIDQFIDRMSMNGAVLLSRTLKDVSLTHRAVAQQLVVDTLTKANGDLRLADLMRTIANIGTRKGKISEPSVAEPTAALAPAATEGSHEVVIDAKPPVPPDQCDPLPASDNANALARIEAALTRIEERLDAIERALADSPSQLGLIRAIADAFAQAAQSKPSQ